LDKTVYLTSLRRSKLTTSRR